MSGKTLTLIGIFAFVVLILGSFIGFIVTWDKDKEQSVTWTLPVMEKEHRA